MQDNLKYAEFFLVAALVFAAYCLSSCAPTPWREANDDPAVVYARLAVQAKTGATLADSVVFIGTPEVVEWACQARTTQCNNFGSIYIAETDEPGYICQRALHEYIHSASQELTGDWDTYHTLYPELYNEFMVSTCSVFF